MGGPLRAGSCCKVDGDEVAFLEAIVEYLRRPEDRERFEKAFQAAQREYNWARYGDWAESSGEDFRSTRNRERFAAWLKKLEDGRQDAWIKVISQAMRFVGSRGPVGDLKRISPFAKYLCVTRHLIQHSGCSGSSWIYRGEAAELDERIMEGRTVRLAFKSTHPHCLLAFEVSGDRT